MNNKREEFLKIYKNTIKRFGSDSLLSWLENSDFFTAPASTRFHGAHEGGLLEHSLNVYKCLNAELAAHSMQEDYPEETISIVSLLHDVCKIDIYKKDYRNVKNKDTGKWEQKEVFVIEEAFPFGDHADKSIILLQDFMQLSPDEIFAIRAHMGGWDNAVKGGSGFVGKIFERSKLALLLHVADLKSTYLLEV